MRPARSVSSAWDDLVLLDGGAGCWDVGEVGEVHSVLPSNNHEGFFEDGVGSAW